MGGAARGSQGEGAQGEAQQEVRCVDQDTQTGSNGPPSLDGAGRPPEPRPALRPEVDLLEQQNSFPRLQHVHVCLGIVYGKVICARRHVVERGPGEVKVQDGRRLYLICSMVCDRIAG